MKFSLFLHVIGMVFWMGGLLSATALQLGFNRFGVGDDLQKKILSRYCMMTILPGVVVSTPTGLYQLLIGGMGTYMKQGWFHGKLTLVIIAYVVTALIVLGCNAETSAERKKFGMLHGLSALCLIGIVFCAEVLR